MILLFYRIRICKPHGKKTQRSSGTMLMAGIKYMIQSDCEFILLKYNLLQSTMLIIIDIGCGSYNCPYIIFIRSLMLHKHRII